ncbi:rRNA adenine N(6)-methyltransferase family protein [Allonocardiopsis opalescens]|uniref:23S rRNA (Adenine-N6)-dimethyltransferase n=1 Tax=Allonocardiopsis opalescens TaxID=1144618 RepID=A0A2T0PTP0_9ACTN|nr:rRNA adenine N(6)-methyltransferase family protein [Allonocardiopsis opalescens]PRX92264.1 23S rRNA (adenine-N6)-dimethyltransferase [Allonocardiopsis opalescens]
MTRRGRGLPASAAGTHFLQSRAVAAALVRSAAPGSGDLVLDLGAGAGAVTAPLADTGARVLAVERNPAFARRLARRFGAHERVRVVHDDLRTVPLPRRPFQVVASIPFAVSTALLRRLLGPPGTRLSGADLIVEWGLARRITRPVPRDLETAWWAARFELCVRARVPADRFAPAPSVDAAHLVVRRRADMGAGAVRGAYALLEAAYATPAAPARAVLGAFVARRDTHRLLAGAGAAPATPAGELTVAQWRALARAASREGTPWPALPRRLDRG